MVRQAAERSRWAPHSVCAVAAAFLLFTATAALAADEPVAAASARLEQIRAQLDRIEASAGKPDQPARALLEYRAETEPLRGELRELIAKVEPIHAQAESRVKQLGAPPAAGQPSEPLAVASEREQQSIMLRDADAALRQARLLAVRADQIMEGIDRQRSDAFTRLLFEQGDSIFTPSLWLAAASALSGEWEKLRGMLADSYATVAARTGAADFSLALFAAFAAALAILILSVTLRRRFGAAAPAPAGDVPLLPQSHKAVLATRDALLDALTAPVMGLAALAILSAFDLFSAAALALAGSLVVSIALFSIAHALARAVLSPHNAYRRLPALDDSAARGLYRLLTNAAAVTAVALFVNELHRSLAISVPLTIATSALYALIIAVLIALTLLSHRAATDDRGAGMPPWIRLSGWLAATAIVVALAAGYIRFGSLVAERVVTAAIVLTALKLLLSLVDAIFGEGLKRDSPRRRAFAATLGLRVKTLDLFAALFAGFLRALVVIAAIFVVAGTLTTTAFNFSFLLDSSALSIQLGQTRIHLTDVVSAVFILLIGFIVTRIFYRWLSREVLPRTDLEASLQNSIATIAGYVGAIVAISLGLARLGVNLENIALIAGALSIGIGFGLQSIVSNFVSGLILLTERPIRVGDWILARGEEGYVRRISVRSTEIETIDRASVILPNSDLITGVVKNWTHAEKLGRFALPVRASYTSDPEQVSEILLAAAKAHPRVVKSPEPSVQFTGFGDSALEFELQGMVENADSRLSTMSDLRFDIFRRFREAEIEIPFPQRNIHIKSAPAEETEPGLNEPR